MLKRTAATIAILALAAPAAATAHPKLSLRRARHAVERVERSFWDRVETESPEPGNPAVLAFARCVEVSSTVAECPVAITASFGSVEIEREGTVTEAPLPRETVHVADMARLVRGRVIVRPVRR